MDIRYAYHCGRWEMVEVWLPVPVEQWAYLATANAQIVLSGSAVLYSFIILPAGSFSREHL